MPTAEPLKRLIEKKKAEALQRIKNAGTPTTAQPTPAAGPGFFGANAPATPPAPKPKTTILPITGIPGGGAIEVPEGIKQPSPMDLVNAGVDLSNRGLYGVINTIKEVTDKKKSSALDVLRAAVRGLSGQDKTTAIDILPKLPDVLPSRVDDPDVRTAMALMKSSPEMARPEFGRGVTANILDTALDPGTYIGVGAAKAALKTAGKAGKAISGAVKKKATTGALEEFAETAATREARSIAIKEAPIPEPLLQKPVKPSQLLRKSDKAVFPKQKLLAQRAEKPRSFPETVAKGDLTGPELKKLIKENPQLYRPINNKDTLSTAQRIIDENPDAARAIVLEGKSFDNATEAAMSQDLIRRAQNAGEWDTAFELMKAASAKFTQSGQVIQAASMWRRMTPEGMLKYANRVFEEANRQIKKGKKIKLTNDLQKKIADDMKVIEGMQDGVAKDLAIAQTLDSIEAQIPVSLWRKISTIQAMSHLLNVRTAMRNLFGNLSFAVEETISNTLAIPVDRVIARWTGKKTVTLPGIKEPLKAGFARAKQSAKEVKSGLHTEPGKYELARGRTFRKGPLSALEKALGYELRVPDEAFKGFREQQALDQMLKMSGLKEPTQEMLEQAAHEARYSTFQDESLPAQILQSIKDAANKVGGGKDIPGAQIRSTKEFGVGDLIIKYTRVPGNIISRSIEYTPVGALRAISLMAQAQKSGVLNQREIALTLGRAMTGTGMIAMGAWLHNKGIMVSQDKDADRDASALQRAAGLTGYKLNMSAIGRAINGESTELQEGDNLYSINWLAPVAVAFVIGATIDAQLKKGGTPAETATAISSNSIDEILDLPTMYVVNSMFYESMRSDSNAFTIAAVPFAEAVPGFIPGPVRQLAQTLDTTARDTRGGSVLETAKLKVQGNIPGARENLQPRISPTGKEITYPGGIFANMVSPATKSVYMPTAYTDELKALEETTGETKMYPPGSAPKSFVWRKERIELTPDERTEYQKIAGQQIDKRFNAIFSYVDVERLNDSQRKAVVERLAKIIGESREYAKFQILRGRLQSAAGE